MICDDISLGPIFERHVSRWNLDLPRTVGKHAAQSGDGRARANCRSESRRVSGTATSCTTTPTGILRLCRNGPGAIIYERVGMIVRSLVDAGVPVPTARAAPSLRAFLEFAFRPLYPAGDLGHLAPLPIRPRS